MVGLIMFSLFSNALKERAVSLAVLTCVPECVNDNAVLARAKQKYITWLNYILVFKKRNHK